jgi:hypothetical protein
MKKNIHYSYWFLSLILMPLELLSFYQETYNDELACYYKNLEFFESQQNKAPYDIEINNDGFDRPYILISLGCNCECAYQLRERKLSGAFFPFDWMRTENFDAISVMLETDFQDFLNKENLVLGNRNSPTASCRLVTDTKHDMKFLHDFPWDKNLEESYDAVKQKYARRIARFYRALATDKQIYFFRRDLVTQTQIINFCNVIQKKFPDLKFTLIVMHNSKECKKKWKIKNVLNFSYKASNSKKLKWSGYYKKPWDVVLAALGIKWTP